MGSLMEARRRILLNSPHVGTVSGSIASFKTDMAIPLKEVSHNAGTLYHAGKNLLPFDLASTKSINSNKTWTGNIAENTTQGFTAECLFDSDGFFIGILCSKTNTTSTASFDVPVPASLYGKTVFLTGCPSGGTGSTYRVILQTTGSGATTYGREYGSGVQVNIPTGLTVVLRYRIAITGIFSDLLFKPMFTVVGDDTTYEPYKAGDGITALTGKNNIWSDSGNVTVKFWTH